MTQQPIVETVAHKTARYALYAVLGTWLAATIVTQDPTRKLDKLRRWDPTGSLIPDWRFFAPRPSMHDYHLLLRDELPNGDHTPWKEICEAETRKWQHFFWYPGRRARKAIADAVPRLIDMRPELTGHNEGVQVRIPYLTLLNYVTHRVPHHPEAKQVQFLIAASAGYDESEEPTMLFLSNSHPLV